MILVAARSRATSRRPSSSEVLALSRRPTPARRPAGPSATRAPRALVAGALLPAALVLAPSAAWAHDSLVGSDPAEGATVPASPDTVTLTYSAEILPQGSAVTVMDAEGTDWVADEPVAQGTDLVVDLRDGLPAGEYRTVWRVVSSDGHPIDGVQTFTVAGGEDPAVPPASQTAQPKDTTGGDAPVSSDADATASDTQVVEPAAPVSEPAGAEASAAEDTGVSRTTLIAGIGALAALAMAGAAIALRRRGAPTDDAGH